MKNTIQIILIASLLVISFSCRKKDTTTINNTGTGTPVSTLPPTYTAGSFVFSQTVRMGFNGGANQYSYSATASFYDSQSNMSIQGIVKADGIAFTQNGYNYNYPLENGISNDTTIWSVPSYTAMQNGFVVKDTIFNLKNVLPSINEVVFTDSIYRHTTYKIPLPISSYELNSLNNIDLSISSSCSQATQASGYLNQAKDSIVFDYNAIFLATKGCPVGISVPLGIGIAASFYKDTTILNHKFHFEFKRNMYTHAYLKAN